MSAIQSIESIESIECKSAEDFLSKIRRSNSNWWEPDGTASSWVFRGIGDADEWKLIPSAWRNEKNDLRPLMNRFGKMVAFFDPHSKETEESRLYYEWVSAEIEALCQFAGAANELGIEVDSAAYQRNRSPIIMKKWAKQFSIGSFGGVGGFEAVAALAQHHGIPTRLLDWSHNPIVAAFFAVAPVFRSKKSKNVCVWALDTSHLSYQGPNEKQFKEFSVLVYRPPRSRNQFLHSQSGVFTYIGNESALENYFLEHKAWPSLEEVIQLVESIRPILISYTLDVKYADDLLILLDREGVNHATLMPALDNVAKTVKERWKRELYAIEKPDWS